jgi:hypothetical protein
VEARGNKTRSLDWRNVSKGRAATGFKIRVRFLRDVIKLPSSDIFFELLVPGVFVTLPNKGHKLVEFLQRELLDRILNFSQTHDANRITV